MTSRTERTERTDNQSRLLDWREVAQRIPLSRTTIWHLRRAGAFPKPTKISKRRVAWHEDEINAWIEARHSA